jgi:hypothetical protein
MTMSWAVMAKMNGIKILYLKARPRVEDLPEPVVDQRYLFCGITTSPVKSFEKISDTLRIETQNSVYLCWLDTIENAGIFAKAKGLPDPVTHISGSIYWGFDNCLSTYIW